MKGQDLGLPPQALDENEFIVTVIKSRGSTFEVQVPPSSMDRLKLAVPQIEGPNVLVGIAPKLRNTMYVRRGGLALISVEQIGKVAGTITNIVSDRRAWQKHGYWPPDLVETKDEYEMDLPPSDSESEGAYASDGSTGAIQETA